MPYRVRIETRAKKSLDSLPKRDGDRIALVVKRLGDDPRPAGCAKIAGSSRNLFRIRVGQHRVVYEIRDRQLLVLVVRIAKRDEGTYRGL